MNQALCCSLGMSDSVQTHRGCRAPSRWDGHILVHGKVTNWDPNFDWKDFPREGHLNQDLKDKEALTRQLGVGDSLGRGKSLSQCSVLE